MSAKGYWFAFGLGATAGAAVALLYAPASGARTRKRISRSIDEGVETMEDAAKYLREQAENLSKQAQATVKRTRSQVDDAMDTVADVVSGAAKSVRSLM